MDFQPSILKIEKENLLVAHFLEFAFIRDYFLGFAYLNTKDEYLSFF